MRGVGKTTLLKRINNELTGGFHHVIWAIASKDCKLGILQKGIAKSLGLALEEDTSTEAVATTISNFLKNKNFLFLLDDLWIAFDLDVVGIPPISGGDDGQHKRKVVITTRFEQLCGNMDANTRIKVNCLKPKEAWRLFEEKVGRETINSNRRIQSLALKVADECAGLPLALITIGRAMSTKKTPQEWEHAIALLKKSRPHEIVGMENKMLPILKFSYDSLQDDAMRVCFLCCSLWPEDYLIPKDELIKCWMGLGLIDDFDEIDEAYNMGCSLIGRLRDACLLEPAYHYDIREEMGMKMHDVIRDMALWIASECGEKRNKWMVRAGVGLMEAPKEAERWREAERMSLMHNGFQSLPHIHDCPSLLTLMLQNNRYLSIIRHAFFLCMPALTYLDLSRTNIEELPREIGTLVELQYLNLSSTFISSLPNELVRLVKLKYLLLENTRFLEIIPPGLISRLPMLRVLDLFYSGYVDWEGGSYDEDNNITARIDELECLGRAGLKALGINIETTQALIRLSSIPCVPVLRLSIIYLQDLASSQQQQLLWLSLLGSQNIWKSLKELLIRQCDALEELMMKGGVLEITDNHNTKGLCLPKLETVHLKYLNKLKEIIWKGVVPAEFLPSLSRLEIVGCYKLKNVTWVLQLPCLEILHLEDCFELVQVIGDVEDGAINGGGEVVVVEEEGPFYAFPSLRGLTLYNLPMLGSICNRVFAFPSLEYVWVDGCQMLNKLPFRSQITQNKLKEIQGNKGWWEGLQWGEDIKSSLRPYFKEIS